MQRSKKCTEYKKERTLLLLATVVYIRKIYPSGDTEERIVKCREELKMLFPVPMFQVYELLHIVVCIVTS